MAARREAGAGLLERVLAMAESCHRRLPSALRNHAEAVSRFVRTVNPGNRSLQFSQRRNALAFWIGSAVVSAGVLLHLPMFWMVRNAGFNMSGMSMDRGMLLGMLLIVVGILAATYGLLPIRRPEAGDCRAFAPPEDAPEV